MTHVEEDKVMVLMDGSLKLVTPEGDPSLGALNSRDPHDGSCGGYGDGRGAAPGLLKAWSAGVGSRL